MKRVLVTGSESQLALCLEELFGNNEDQVEYVFKSRQEFDINKPGSVLDLLKRESFDYCLNCAAYTNVEQAEQEKEEAYRTNAKGVHFLAKALKKNNTVLIHVSTDYVFDGKTKQPYKTNDKTNPINHYGASKLMGEEAIRLIMDRYFIIRTSWLYSPYGKNFVKTILDRVKKKEALNVITTQTGSPTSAYELARFVHFLISQEESNFGLYHFTAANEASWFDLAEYVVSGNESYPRDRLSGIESFETLALRPEYSVLDLEKTRSIYPHIRTWQEGVDMVLKRI